MLISIRSGGKVREQHRAERRVAVRDGRRAARLGEQLAAHPLTGCVRPRVGVHQGPARGLPQPLIERDAVPQRSARTQRAGQTPDRHRRRPALTILEPVDGPPIEPGCVGEPTLGPGAPFDPEHDTEGAPQADLLGSVWHPVPPFARAGRVVRCAAHGTTVPQPPGAAADRLGGGQKMTEPVYTLPFTRLPNQPPPASPITHAVVVVCGCSHLLTTQSSLTYLSAAGGHRGQRASPAAGPNTAATSAPTAGSNRHRR